MITREQADGLRNQLMEVLAEDAHNTKRLLARLDSITRESGIGAHAALLLILTQLSFEESEAREHWEKILAHRHDMSLAVGRDVGVRVALVDYFMNINRRLVQPTLIDVELFYAVESAADGDPLTGLPADRAFRGSLQTELRRAKRYRQKVALALFDIDDFAETNQALGKLLSDRLLRELAILLKNKIRDIDLAARPGEDELALVLPETDRNGAMLVAERFRREVEAHFARRAAGDSFAELTVSGGVACYPDDALSVEDLLERAAQALYHAKATGKNAVQLYLPERRRYLRFDLESGHFEIEVLAPPDFSAARARNVSRNGVLFTSPEPLNVGEHIEIRMLAHEEDPAASTPALRVRGRVVRLEELPEPAAGEPAPGPAGDPADRFDVGVAFELDGSEEADDLVSFLEKARGGGLPDRS